MIRFYTAANLQEAYIVFNLLSHSGIEARVFNENAQGGVGEIPFTHAYPEVWLVDANDRERANQVLAEYESAAPDERVRRCASCGENNPGNFQICWFCGKPIT